MPIFCTANIQSRQQKLGKRKPKLGGKPSGIFCRLGSVNISLRVQHTSTFASQLYPSYFLICAARPAAKPAMAWRIRQKQLRMIQSKNRLQLVDQSEASIHGLASLSVWQRLTQLQNLLDSHCEKTVNFRKSFSHKKSLWNSKLLDTRYVFYFLDVLNYIIH